MERLNWALAVTAALGVIAVVSSCQLALSEPAAADASPQGAGLVELAVDDLPARGLTSDADMTAVYYVFTATGPEGATFTATTSNPQVKMTVQIGGDWTVTAEAFNSDDALIARGVKTVAIVAGQPKSVKIAVKPITGEGALAVNMEWDGDKYPSASATARLNLQGGTVLDLAVTSGIGAATSFTSGVPAGKHSLVVKLMNGKVLVVRNTQTVQIYNEATTSGTVELFDTAAMDVAVTVDMFAPLQVAISGIVDPLIAGAAMTATGSTGGEPEGVAYLWHLNGLPQATGDRWTFGSDLKPGMYRVDLTATSGDATRAGSAAAVFRVME
jgi:hypothetical protein